MARKELTKSKAQEYARAPKKRKGEMLDVLCEDTGWSRDNARRQLKRALGRPRGKPERKGRALKYSARARQVLANAWALSGCACGLYFEAQVKEGLLERLAESRSLRDGRKNSGGPVGQGDPALDEVRSMSPATVDRYLAPLKRAFEPASRSTARRSSYPLRNEIPFGKSYGGRSGPGWLSTDTGAHCGHSLKGDHLWTLNSTDVVTGWTETVTVRSRARRWIIEGHDRILGNFPYPVKGINYDGGSEFVNYEMVDYAKLHNYQMTRSRPYRSNDNAHVEQKNYDIVRKNAFRYRYDGDEAKGVLNELWKWVNIRKNYLVPTRKCIGHTKTGSGRTRGVYDKPKTPYRRIMECGEVSDKAKEALSKTYRSLDDAAVTRTIIELQQKLLTLVVDEDMLEFINEQIESAQAA